MARSEAQPEAQSEAQPEAQPETTITPTAIVKYIFGAAKYIVLSLMLSIYLIYKQNNRTSLNILKALLPFLLVITIICRIF